MSEEKKEQKPGTMVMFKVTEKKKENSPDFQGSGCLKPEDIEAIQENGGLVRISCWTKLPKGGGPPYISGFIEAQKKWNGDRSAPEAADDFITTPAIAQATSGNVEDAVVVEDSGMPF